MALCQGFLNGHFATDGNLVAACGSLKRFCDPDVKGLKVGFAASALGAPNNVVELGLPNTVAGDWPMSGIGGMPNSPAPGVNVMIFVKNRLRKLAKLGQKILNHKICSANAFCNITPYHSPQGNLKFSVTNCARLPNCFKINLLYILYF
jgi:hypothetical protein